MARTLETSIRIGGALASSFSSTFSNASNRLSDLSQEARRTQREIDRLGNDFRQGRIHQTQYAESTERLTREMRQLEAAQRRIGAISGTMSKGFSTAKMVGGMAATAVATTATAVAMKSLNTAADFESKMSAVGAKTEATTTEMKALNQSAMELGAKSSLSASEVAVSMDELAAKGFDVNKIIGAMPGIISAAEASGEDLALTSDTVATAINVWGLEASEASRVADVLAMSANVSAAGIGDLAQVFKYAGGAGSDLGYSLESISAAAGIMTDAGLEGSNAGTALRASLLALNNPVKAQEKLMKKLGFSAKDSEKNFKPLSAIVKDLTESTKHMTDAERVATIAKLVGTEAVGGFLALMSAGPEKIDKMTEALENSEGAAAKAAAVMKDNYGGALEQLGGSFESAQIAFATPILPVFQDLFNGLGASIDGSMGGIEQAGQKVAAALSDVFDPFSTQEPIKPNLMDVGSISNYSVLMEEYQQDLEKFNKFSGMDFGDKFVYMLDTATDKLEGWLSGSGGDSMNKIFTKLGEIAASAWLAAFKGSVKSAGSNLMEGNIMPAVGMGAAAWMMGGGLMVKGAIGAGRMATGAFNSRRSATQPPVPPSPTPIIPPSGGGNPSNTRSARRAANAGNPPDTTNSRASRRAGAPSMGGRVSNALKPVGKVLGKAALPVTLATSAISIISSNDKKKSAVEEGAGLAGGLAGAKLGATIGTFIAPGIGTAIGGALGGLAGYAGAKWLGGKAVDKTREGSSPAAAVSTTSTSAATVSSTSSISLDQPTANLKSAMEMGAGNFKILATHAAEASNHVVGSFLAIKSSADLVKGNLDILTTWTGMASGWLASLNGIQPAGQGVIQALNDLTARINNAQIPGVSNKRVSFDG